jgi:putative transcriptional regulator
MDRAVQKPKSPAFLAEELPQDRALRLGGARLLGAVAELPLRYAPFVGRLAGLWEMPEQQVLSELARAKDPKAWSYTLLRGLKIFNVARSASSPVRARLMRLQPGVHFPKHAHRGSESVLVLEGAYADATGVEVHAGETQTMPEGSEHELHILGSEPCVAAVAEHGIEFTSPWLRWANKLLR